MKIICGVFSTYRNFIAYLLYNLIVEHPGSFITVACQICTKGRNILGSDFVRSGAGCQGLSSVFKFSTLLLFPFLTVRSKP